ncbi:hypothetical protein GCM10027098_31370 [Bowmanella dokdonensis]
MLKPGNGAVQGWNKLKPLTLIFLLALLAGCESEPEQTESMLRLQRAHDEAGVWLDKASLQLTEEAFRAPKQHIGSILYGHELLQEARQVYRRADIRGLELPQLSQLELRLQEVNPVLADHALTLMQDVKDRTLLLRGKISDLKATEYGSAKTSSAESIKYLSRLYNQDINDCCLKDIYKIAQILASRSGQEYEQVIRLSARLTNEMVRILKRPEYASPFEQQLVALRQSLPSERRNALHQ